MGGETEQPLLSCRWPLGDHRHGTDSQAFLGQAIVTGTGERSGPSSTVCHGPSPTEGHQEPSTVHRWGPSGVGVRVM